MLTKQITLEEVKDAGDKHKGCLYKVRIKLEVTDDSGPGFVKTYTADYKRDVDGKTTGDIVQRIEDDIAERIKADIAKYKREQTALAEIQAENLVGSLDTKVKV